MKITSITQQKRNPDNVNIFIDNEYFCSLSKNQLISFGLHKNFEVTESFKEELKNASGKNKLREKINNYLLRRPRSIKEVRDYLVYRKGVDKNEADALIQEYLEKGLLNDTAFCEWFVEMRLAAKKHGRNKIKAELIKKGVDTKIIAAVLHEKADKQVEQETIQKLYESLDNKITETDPWKKREKITRRLLSKGFSYDEIKQVVSNKS